MDFLWLLSSISIDPIAIYYICLLPNVKIESVKSLHLPTEDDVLAS